MNQCQECGIELDIDNWRHNFKEYDIRICKECEKQRQVYRKEKQKEKQRKDKENIGIKAREYYKQNKDKYKSEAHKMLCDILRT